MATRVSGLLALVCATVFAIPIGAGANPNWTLWNEGTNAPLTSSDVVNAAGLMRFQAGVGGTNATIDCRFTTAQPLRLSTSGPFSAPPGGTLTLVASLPTPTVCTSGTRNIPTTVSGPWSFTLSMPMAGSVPGQLYDDTLGRTLSVPANSVTWDLSSVCAGTTATGPTFPKSFSGSYSSATGSDVVSPVPQSFAMSYTGCTVTNARLIASNLLLDPVVDLQW
ncbi:hypothetical protein [Knoellia remsis]|nr:hypothetical protein [Knoellia remsis]